MKLRRRHLIPLAAAAGLVGLVAGVWWYLSTPTHRARRLVGELRGRPAPPESWLIDLGVMDGPPPRERSQIADDLVALGPAAVEPLVDLLNAPAGDDPEAELRCMAAGLLGEIGRPAAPAGPHLVAALGDANPNLRFHAARALGEIAPASQDAIEALVAALGDRGTLRDSVETVCKAAGESLGRIGPRAAPALLDALYDRRWGVRAHAAESIGRIRPLVLQAVPVLIDLLRDEHDPYVVSRAAIGLEHMGPSLRLSSAEAAGQAVEALRWAGRRDGGDVAKACIRALKQIGTAAAPATVTGLAWERRLGLSPRQEDRLRRWLGDRGGQVPAAALAAMLEGLLEEAQRAALHEAARCGAVLPAEPVHPPPAADAAVDWGGERGSLQMAVLPVRDHLAASAEFVEYDILLRSVARREPIRAFLPQVGWDGGVTTARIVHRDRAARRAGRDVSRTACGPAIVRLRPGEVIAVRHRIALPPIRPARGGSERRPSYRPQRPGRLKLHVTYAMPYGMEKQIGRSGVLTAEVPLTVADGRPDGGRADRELFVRDFPAAKRLAWGRPKADGPVVLYVPGQETSTPWGVAPDPGRVAVFDRTGREIYYRAARGRGPWGWEGLDAPRALPLPGRAVVFPRRWWSPAKAWGTELMLLGLRADRAVELELAFTAGASAPMGHNNRTWIEDVDGDGRLEICQFPWDIYHHGDPANHRLRCLRWDERAGQWQWLSRLTARRIAKRRAPIRWLVRAAPDAAGGTIDLRLDLTSLADKPLTLSQPLEPLVRGAAGVCGVAPEEGFRCPVIVRAGREWGRINWPVTPQTDLPPAVTLRPGETLSGRFGVTVPKTEKPGADFNIRIIGRARWRRFEANFSRQALVPFAQDDLGDAQRAADAEVRSCVLNGKPLNASDYWIRLMSPVLRRWLVERAAAGDGAALTVLQQDPADETGRLALEALRARATTAPKAAAALLRLALTRLDPQDYAAAVQAAGGPGRALRPALEILLKTAEPHGYLDRTALAEVLAPPGTTAPAPPGTTTVEPGANRGN